MIAIITRNINKILFFTVNGLLAVLLVCIIKHFDEKNYSLVVEEENEFLPIDQKVTDFQQKIFLERENKLRKLNNTPGELRQEKITTKKTTNTPDPVVSTPQTTNNNANIGTKKTTTTTKPKVDKKTKTS